ncbi:MAG: phosphoribosylanthranilate isomerase [Deltaproteobacteria bacterium]|nr:phosphoribosylanthranilate isomerase [Deltaproteobacteria bacterium]
MVQVKICGITRMADAEAAVDLGADALGFVFANSPRQVTPQKARDITRRISPFVKTVGVFVNEQSAKIREITNFCGLDLIQLHGNEPVSVCSDLAPRVIKAFRVQGEKSLLEITDFKDHVRAILLDAYQKGLNGGTGKTFDWRLALKAKETGIPMVLSGGLGSDNIAEALERVAPFAIDVSSGIEKEPGIKDHGRMRIFMEKIKNYERKGTARRAPTISPEV